MSGASGPSHVDRIRAQFTRQADAYAATDQARDLAGMRRLARLAGAGPGLRALDVACGPGVLTLALAEACESALGVDATEALLAHARRLAAEHGAANLRFQAGDARALPLPAAAFDVVTCRAAFHHFEAPAEVLAEMRRVARPGATLLVADFVSSEDPARAAYHNRIEALCDPTHVRALTDAELRGLFEAAGLRLEASPRSRLDYDLDGWIAHGGPGPEAEGEIRALLEACLDDDLAGLDVRRDAQGRLWFSQTGVAYRLAVPSA